MNTKTVSTSKTFVQTIFSVMSIKKYIYIYFDCSLSELSVWTYHKTHNAPKQNDSHHLMLHKESELQNVGVKANFYYSFISGISANPSCFLIKLFLWETNNHCIARWTALTMLKMGKLFFTTTWQHDIKCKCILICHFSLLYFWKKKLLLLCCWRKCSLCIFGCK